MQHEWTGKGLGGRGVREYNASCAACLCFARRGRCEQLTSAGECSGAQFANELNMQVKSKQPLLLARVHVSLADSYAL